AGPWCIRIVTADRQRRHAFGPWKTHSEMVPAFAGTTPHSGECPTPGPAGTWDRNARAAEHLLQVARGLICRVEVGDRGSANRANGTRRNGGGRPKPLRGSRAQEVGRGIQETDGVARRRQGPGPHVLDHHLRAGGGAAVQGADGRLDLRVEQTLLAL